MSFSRELEFAIAVSQEAGKIALRYQAERPEAETKADESPVTIADRECEALIARRIAGQFSEDGMLGEEGANQASQSGRRWIIDPIDGTRDFIRGNPYWSVLLGLEAEGEIVAGVCHLPGLGKTYSAQRNAGAHCNGERIQVSPITAVNKSVLCVNGLQYVHGEAIGPRLIEWVSQFWAVRSMGGCMDAMMLASGQAEAWVEPRSAPWDLAPLQIILEEAGARLFSFAGERTIYGGNAVACVPALEGEMRSLLQLRWASS